MPHEETSAAVASILSNFAKQYPPVDEHSFPAGAAANGVKNRQITLPGDDTVEKRTLERELTALGTRIQYLEAKAAGGANSLPATPNGPQTSAFGSSDTPSNATSPRTAKESGQKHRSASWVNSILAKNEGESQNRHLTEEQFAFLREHIDQQAEEIKSQREFIDGIKAQLTHQQSATKAALDTLGNS
ncbi:hypothetical protein KC331_g22627, partial [Hortaea werneckii]